MWTGAQAHLSGLGAWLLQTSGTVVTSLAEVEAQPES